MTDINSSPSSVLTELHVLKYIRPEVDSVELPDALVAACEAHPLATHLNVLWYVQLYNSMDEDELERFHRFCSAMMFKVYRKEEVWGGEKLNWLVLSDHQEDRSELILYLIMLQYYALS